MKRLFILWLIIFDFVIAEVLIENFFPFGVDNGDTELVRGSDISSPPQNLTNSFPFFGVPQPRLWVNENGLISFNRKISEFTPLCRAAASDYQIVAPFWADVDARHTGDIFYRQSTDPNILLKGEQELAQAFPDIHHIQLTWAFIATWENVTYFVDPPDSNESERKRNTFQAVLLSDGSQSFVIFYYNEVTWTTGDVSGGTDGLGGTPAEVGYDFGDGLHYAFANGSCSNAIIDISGTSNVGSAGKWIFKTFESEPTPPPSCEDKYSGDFCLVPYSVDTIGYQLQDIYGIQLSVTDSATCIYYDPYTNSTEIEANIVSLTHIQCTTPPFFSTGRINMEVAVIDGDDFGNSTNRTYTGYVYVSIPTEADNTLNFTVLTNGSLMFSWNPTDMNRQQQQIQEEESVWKLVYMKTCVRVLKVVEFCERHPVLCEFCVKHPFLCLDIEGIAVDVRGEFEKKSYHSDLTAEELLAGIILLLPIGLFEEEKYHAHDTTSAFKKICNEEMDPNEMLCSGAWYVAQYIGEIQQGRPLFNMGKDVAAWIGENCPNAKQMCQRLLGNFGDSYSEDEKLAVTTDPNEPRFTPPTDVGYCPPTLDLAEVDPNFVVDLFCPGNVACFYNPGAEICYNSAVPSPSGGGQHCCYQNRQIFLKKPGAGFPSIIHPSIQVGLAHASIDQYPCIFCCYASGEEDSEECRKCIGDRNPDPGLNYSSPTGSLGNGDPHYTTFDGLYYTFNGAGEFWLLKNSTEQPVAAQVRHILPNGNTSSTYALLEAYALRAHPNASIVQVEIGSSDGSISVYYDGVPIPETILAKTFSSIDTAITLYDNSVYITFSTGFSFKFSQMALVGYANSNYKGNFTHGILGTFDGNPFNDLETPIGVIVPANSTTQVIHYKFGLECGRKDFQLTALYYYYPNFTPNFGYSAGQLPPGAAEVCGTDPSCLWDLVTTGNEELANQTRGNGQDFNNTVSTTNKTITRCPPLTDPANGQCLVNNYLSNTTATFVCNSGYELVGDKVLICTTDGTWNGTDPVCELTWSSTEMSSTIERVTTTNPQARTTPTAAPTTSNSKKAIPNSIPHFVFAFLFIIKKIV